MDLFLRFLILGGKYLSQLTAQSIIEAYRRSIQLGRTLNVHAQHAVTVVSHYDNILEMYQKNLEEFHTLPNAHLAFISEQHRQEFETYMHDVNLVSDEEMFAIFKHHTPNSSESENSAWESSYVQQMTESILGSCGKHKVPRHSLNSNPRGSMDAPMDELTVDEADVENVGFVTQENVKGYNCLSPRTTQVMKMFKDSEQDGVLNTVAEYLDRQAEYIKCANDTFKQLQVDIAKKYAQMQQQTLQQQQEEIEREKLFSQKLRAVQQEVEHCTKLMKKAQDHFDLTEEDKKTNKLFGSIDKIIKDVESITRLMQINEECFQECENVHYLREKGSPDSDYSQLMDVNLSAFNKLSCNILGQQLQQYTNKSLRVYSTSAASLISPIDCHILGFLNKQTKIEQEKILEVNQKAFENTEKILKYPLIGRWNNHLKKSRKSANQPRDKDKKIKKKRGTLPVKKSYKCSKTLSYGTQLSGQPLHRGSKEKLLMSNYAAWSSTWIQDYQDVDPCCNMLEEEPTPKRFVGINKAIKRFLGKRSKTELSAEDKATEPSENLLVIDEKLDLLVEQLLSSMNEVSVPPPSSPRNQGGFDNIYDANASDELKMKAFSEIKKEIDNNVQNVRAQRAAEPLDSVAFDLMSINDHPLTETAMSEAVVEQFPAANTEGQVMFDGIPVEEAPMDFDAAMDAFTVKVARAHSESKSLVQAVGSEVDELEAVRRIASEEAVLQQAVEDAKRVEAANEARRVEAHQALQEVKAARAKSMQNASRNAYKEAVKEHRTMDDNVLFEISQDVGRMAAFQLDTINGNVDPASVALESDVVAAQGSDAISKICDQVDFEPLEIAIDYPDPNCKNSQVSLHISVTPYIENVYEKAEEQPGPSEDAPVLTNYGESTEIHEVKPINSLPSLKNVVLENNEINVTDLMEDVVAEMEEKEKVREWQRANRLINMTNEMNEAAKNKSQQSIDIMTVGKHLLSFFNLESSPATGNPEILVADHQVPQLSAHRQKMMEDKNLNITMNTLKCVEDLIKQQEINPRLATDVTTVKSVPSFRKTYAETKSKWNKWKHLDMKSRRICKSYTVVKTKTSEITLMDMINGGSRSTSSPRDKMTGTRQISHGIQTKSETILKKLKASPARTALRLQSKDVKLIPMNLIQPDKVPRTPAPCEIVEEPRPEPPKSVNPYRDGCAKSFAKTPLPEIPQESEQNESEKVSSHIKSHNINLEKILEASSNRIYPKQPEFIHLSNHKQLNIDRHNMMNVGRKHEELVQKEELPVEEKRSNKGDAFEALSKIQSIRNRYETSMKRTPSYTFNQTDASHKGGFTSMGPNSIKKIMPQDSRLKNSHNASVDGGNEDYQQSKHSTSVSMMKQTTQRPAGKMLNPEMPIVELERFQSPVKPQSAPSSARLKQDAYMVQPEMIHDLKMKNPSHLESEVVHSKSDETLRTIESRESRESRDSEYSPRTRLTQVAPNYIIEEPIPKRPKLRARSSNKSNDGNNYGQRDDQSDDGDLYSLQINIPHRPEPPPRAVDYDVVYKHDKPDIVAPRSIHKPVNPLIKETIESYHKYNNEESVKRGQMGGKFIINYEPTAAAAKAESFGMRGPQQPDGADEYPDDVSISIEVMDEMNKEEFVSNADRKKAKPMKPYQLRNQSSVSDHCLTPHSSYARMRPKLEHLPTLDMIVENIAEEKACKQEQTRIEVAQTPRNSNADVKGFVMTDPQVDPGQNQVQSSVSCPLPSSSQFQTPADDLPRCAQFVGEDDYIPKQKYSRSSASDNYMAPPDLKTFNFEEYEEPSMKVELLNPHTEEKIVYNFSPKPANPVSMIPLLTETTSVTSSNNSPRMSQEMRSEGADYVPPSVQTKVQQQVQPKVLHVQPKIQQEQAKIQQEQPKIQLEQPKVQQMQIKVQQEPPKMQLQPKIQQEMPRLQQEQPRIPQEPRKVEQVQPKIIQLQPKVAIQQEQPAKVEKPVIKIQPLRKPKFTNLEVKSPGRPVIEESPKESNYSLPSPSAMQLNKLRDAQKVAIAPTQVWKRTFAPKTSPDSTDARKISPLNEAIRNSRVQFQQDSDAISISELNRLSVQRLAKPLPASANRSEATNPVSRPKSPPVPEVIVKQEEVCEAAKLVTLPKAVVNKPREDPPAPPPLPPVVVKPTIVCDVFKPPIPVETNTSPKPPVIQKFTECMNNYTTKVPKLVIKESTDLKETKETKEIKEQPQINRMQSPRRLKSTSEISYSRPGQPKFKVRSKHKTTDDLDKEAYQSTKIPKFSFPKKPVSYTNKAKAEATFAHLNERGAKITRTVSIPKPVFKVDAKSVNSFTPRTKGVSAKNAQSQNVSLPRSPRPNESRTVPEIKVQAQSLSPSRPPRSPRSAASRSVAETKLQAQSEIQKASHTCQKSTSLAKIEISTAKPTYDMSSVATDMLRSGASLQYLNQLSTEMKNPFYDELLEKCYTKEKQQADEMKTAQSIKKIQALISPLQAQTTTSAEVRSSASPQRQNTSPPKTPKSASLKTRAEPTKSQQKQPPQEMQTKATAALNSPRMMPNRNKTSFNQESFIAVDGLASANKPVIKTYSKIVIDNIGRRSKDVRTSSPGQRNTKNINIKPIQAKTKAELERYTQPKPDDQMPEFMKTKASERERNLKRLIVLEEKIKHLELKHAKKTEKGSAGPPLDKTLVNVLEEMRHKKSSKFPESTFRRIATTFKENSGINTHYRKSYSNIHTTKDAWIRKARDSRRCKPSLSYEETGSRVEEEPVQAMVPRRLIVRTTVVNQHKQEDKPDEMVEVHAQPMEEFIKIPKLNLKKMLKPKVAAMWASATTTQPPTTTPNPQSSKPAITTPSTARPRTKPHASQNPEPEDVQSPIAQWKLPIAKRKNLLPNVPELKNTEIVIPKKATVNFDVKSCLRPVTPHSPRMPSPITIDPPPFRSGPKYTPSKDGYEPTHFVEPPTNSKHYVEDAEEIMPAQIRAPSPEPNAPAKVYMPYALKFQRPLEEEDNTVVKPTQFDAKKTKTLKFFQNKVKQAIKKIEVIEKEKEEKDKTFHMPKKSIHPYTNTFGRHLIRLRAESDMEHRHRSPEEYQKALIERLQRLSSLPKAQAQVKADTPETFVYRPPIDKGGIRFSKKPSLSEVKRTILKHLRDTTTPRKRLLGRSSATA